MGPCRLCLSNHSLSLQLPLARATIVSGMFPAPALQKEKGEGKRRELQSHLTRLQQMMSEEKTRRKAKELEQGWKVGGVKLSSKGSPFGGGGEGGRSAARLWGAGGGCSTARF